MNLYELGRKWLNSLSDYTMYRIFPTMVILLVGLLVIRIVMKIITGALNRSGLEKGAHTLIKSLARISMGILLTLILASHLGFDVTGIVALASVLTLAVSLALQNALANVIGGFSLLYNKPFSSGDFVEIADRSGTVLEIGLTYTKLSTPDNKIVSIPNSSVVATEIVNYTVSGTRRVALNISASYDAPVEKVLEVLRKAGDQPTRLKEKEPFAAVESYGDSAIRYLLHVWCKTEDFWTTQCETTRQIKVLFDEAGIEMTYPHLNVHLVTPK